MQISRGGVQPLEQAARPTDTCLSKLAHQEMSARQVERFFFFCIVSMSILSQTGDDTETLNKLEARIQAGFKDGVPPHLQSSAKSRTYTPGCNQSRIFVASHSEFSNLHPREVQRILRERLILVHNTPFDYQYGWDLESFGRLHDVDKKITVNGKIGLPFLQGALTQTTFSVYKSSSPPARASPLPGHLTGTTLHNDDSVK
jgi:hypothetical protein